MSIERTRASAIETEPQFTEQELRAIEQYQKDLAKLLAQEPKRATYKIEVVFSHERSTYKPMFGGVVLWFSGSEYHGGGDSKAYWCPQCGSIIPPMAHDVVHSACPECGWHGPGKDLVGEYYYRLPLQHWATVLLDHYQRCNFDANILLRYHPEVLHKVYASLQERASNADRLDQLRVRRLLDGSMYHMHSILKDVSAGSELRTRFRAFLAA